MPSWSARCGGQAHARVDVADAHLGLDGQAAGRRLGRREMGDRAVVPGDQVHHLRELVRIVRAQAEQDPVVLAPDEASGQAPQRPQREDDDRRRRDGHDPRAGSGRHADRGDRPQAGGRGQATDGRALLEDRAGAQEAHAGDDLGRDPRRVGAGCREGIDRQDGEARRPERHEQMGAHPRGMLVDLALEADERAEHRRPEQADDDRQLEAEVEIHRRSVRGRLVPLGDEEAVADHGQRRLDDALALGRRDHPLAQQDRGPVDRGPGRLLGTRPRDGQRAVPVEGVEGRREDVVGRRIVGDVEVRRAGPEGDLEEPGLLEGERDVRPAGRPEVGARVAAVGRRASAGRGALGQRPPTAARSPSRLGKCRYAALGETPTWRAASRRTTPSTPPAEASSVAASMSARRRSPWW